MFSENGFKACFAVAALVNVGILAFAIWVVVKLLQHFGVI